MESEKNVSVASLNPADFEGFMTKCGGGTKTWHKRFVNQFVWIHLVLTSSWFVLKGNRLYYFKTKKDDVITGLVALTAESFVRKEPSYKKKSKNTFAVGTTSRIFYMFPDSQLETDQWVAVINKNIEQIRNPKKDVVIVSPKNDNPPYKNDPPKQITTPPVKQPQPEPENISEDEKPINWNPNNDAVRAGTIEVIELESI